MEEDGAVRRSRSASPEASSRLQQLRPDTRIHIPSLQPQLQAEAEAASARDKVYEDRWVLRQENVDPALLAQLTDMGFDVRVAVVALERTSELLRAASSNVLRFKTDGHALPPALAAKARITGRIVQLPAHDAREIEAYLAAVREAGLVAEDVEIRKADLEDVFLDVMADRQKAGAAPAASSPASLEAAP